MTRLARTPAAYGLGALALAVAGVFATASLRGAPEADEAIAATNATGTVVEEGGQIVRITDAGRTVLSKGLSLARSPSVRHDGSKVLFVGRERDGDPLSVFECAPDGTERRVAVRAPDGLDCGAAAHLPDGRIVHAASVADASPRGAPERNGSAIFVSGGDGKPSARITWGGYDTDPTLLSDGRVLYASFRPRADGARFVLCTVHPDGTGAAPFHVGPESALRPRQIDSLDVAFLETPAGGAAPRWVTVPWDAPMSAPETAAGLRVGVSLAPRPRAQGHLSAVRPERAFGTIVAIDARVGGKGSAVRFVGHDEVFGPVRLAGDGSFAVRVPADTPLRTEVLDDAGAVVAAESGSLWVRPGETRICVGCHDDPQTGPPNVRPLALRNDPADLTQGRSER